jgi:hypothetical protein
MDEENPRRSAAAEAAEGLRAIFVRPCGIIATEMARIHEIIDSLLRNYEETEEIEGSLFLRAFPFLGPLLTLLAYEAPALPYVLAIRKPPCLIHTSTSVSQDVGSGIGSSDRVLMTTE